ncbi:MAG: class I SAM-dependent methyltransferase [Nostoc sp.]|uniref:class I SAM-dependent methyltransferase n=1 Tax=Nostoc sp. TaxID=1180 RepID=UPI002FF96941
MEQLTGVSETLLIPLYAKFLETQREDGIIKDEKSSEIINQLNLDLKKFSQGFWSTQISCAVRTEILDQAVDEFLAKNPEAVVVNLGAGLCTRFSRLNNNVIRWFELDLPQVKPVWEIVFEETERHKFLAYSVLDFSWIKEIKPFVKSPILFIAEGLLMYLSEEEVKRLFREINQSFPQAEILFEALSPIITSNSQRHAAVSKTDAVFQWGIQTGKELETWDKNIQFIQEWYYVDRHSSRWRWLQLFKYVPFLRKSMKIIRISFRAA